ncbi:MAG: hypothetical protein K2H20_00420 [Bacilli bacterium]|nr:hypothetical protein [Bacilli bacterium]
MEVKGYKAFNKDMTNRYGLPFEVGSTYRVEGDVKFGNEGNGFHMCQNLCDVFRYFDSENVAVAEVIGRGKCVKFDDEYNGYYDMYACEEITIVRILSREEILETMMSSHDINNKKFLSTYILTEEEKKEYLRLYHKNMTMLEWLLYYQFGYKQIFSMELTEKKNELRKVFRYGQDNNKGS